MNSVVLDDVVNQYSK